MKIILEPGEIYYFQQRVRPGGFNPRVMQELLLEEREIEKALKKSKYVTPTDRARKKAAEYIERLYETAKKTNAVYPETVEGDSPEDD